MKTNLDIVQDCDNFPYDEDAARDFWGFYLEGEEHPVGFLPEWVIETMPWNEFWKVDHKKKQVTSLLRSHTENSHSLNISTMLQQARESDIFEVLRGWRNELYGFHGHHERNKTGLTMERSGSPLFGINTYGVHMTAYLNTSKGMMIWVPRRSYSKQTYPGMLDNTVAGGLSSGEDPFDCIVREAKEEASLDMDLCRNSIKPCGTVSYILVRDEKAGGESGLFQPECQFVYDLELPQDVECRPNDNEVEAFELWDVGKVRNAMTNGEFKPNCAMVLLDFLIRHGILTAGNESDYIEIVSRLHRKLPFPTS